MFERNAVQVLGSRLLEKRKFIQVVTGPRQVGKTTILIQLLEKTSISHTFETTDAMPATNSIWIEQVWNSARTSMDQGESEEHLLVIDEIQKIENWSEVVKRLWDEDTMKKRNLKVVLLGLHGFWCSRD